LFTQYPYSIRGRGHRHHLHDKRICGPGGLNRNRVRVHRLAPPGNRSLEIEPSWSDSTLTTSGLLRKASFAARLIRSPQEFVAAFARFSN
jgi:hypothetical protein